MGTSDRGIGNVLKYLFAIVGNPLGPLELDRQLFRAVRAFPQNSGTAPIRAPLRNMAGKRGNSADKVSGFR